MYEFSFVYKSYPNGWVGTFTIRIHFWSLHDQSKEVWKLPTVLHCPHWGKELQPDPLSWKGGLLGWAEQWASAIEFMKPTLPLLMCMLSTWRLHSIHPCQRIRRENHNHMRRALGRTTIKKSLSPWSGGRWEMASIQRMRQQARPKASYLFERGTK